MFIHKDVINIIYHFNYSISIFAFRHDLHVCVFPFLWPVIFLTVKARQAQAHFSDENVHFSDENVHFSNENVHFSDENVQL